MKNIICSLLFILPVLLWGKEIAVTTPQELEKAVKNAAPGDKIIIDNTSPWKDVKLKVSGKGNKEHPILITTADNQALFIEGISSLSIGGEYLHIRNFYFRRGQAPDKYLIRFRTSQDNLANHCTIENFVIDHYNKPHRFDNDNWVVLYGKHNTVTKCTFDGKINSGPMLIVEIEDEKSQQNFHTIRHNHFKNRYRLGSNGGETMRFGVSRYSIYDSNTQLIDNYFEHCSGETEIVSIKSGSNYIARNVFWECEGSIVLRHGDHNVVDGNLFDGNFKKETGGIRIVNSGHTIKNNTLKNLRGKGFRAPLAIMNGVPNSLINRYMPVKDVEIFDNTFVDSEILVFGAGNDNERSVAPQNIIFRDNSFVHYPKEWYINTNDGGIIFQNNKFTDQYTNKAMPSDRFGSSLAVRKQVDGSIKPVKHLVTDAAHLQQYLDDAHANDTLLLQLNHTHISLKEPLKINKPIALIATQPYTFVSNSFKSMPAFILITNGGSLHIANFHFLGTFESYGNVGAGISTDKAGVLQSYQLTVKNCTFTDFNESSFAGIKAEKSSFADSLIVKNCFFYNISGTGIAFNAEKEDKGIYNVENALIQDCIFSNILGSAIDIYRGGNDESTTGPFVEIYHCTFNEVDNKEQGAAIRLIGPQFIRFAYNNIYQSGQGGRSIECREFRYHDIKIENSNFYETGKIDTFYPHNIGKNTALLPALIPYSKLNKKLPQSFNKNKTIGSHELL